MKDTKKKLKGKDLEIGMYVVIARMPKKTNKNNRTLNSCPLKVVAIEYPHVVFQYEREVQGMPFLPVPPVIKNEQMAFDVRGYRFRQVSQEYVDALSKAVTQVGGEPSPWREQQEP